MRNVLLFLVLSLPLLSCSHKEKPRESINVVIDSSGRLPRVPGPPILGHRFSITGDFDGDRRPDTLEEHLVDSATGEEAYKYRADVDFEDNLADIHRRWPICYIGPRSGGIDTINLAARYSSYGLAFLRNEGDLDGNGTDEISWVVDYADFSSVNSCVVATFTPKGWRELLVFEMREWQLPQLPGEAKEYGMFGVQGAEHGEHDDTITAHLRSELVSFSFIDRIRPGLIHVRTFDEDVDTVTKVIRLRRF